MPLHTSTPRCSIAPPAGCSNVTGFRFSTTRPSSGQWKPFSHESGIHQDGMLKNVETTSMRPAMWVCNATSLMLGNCRAHAFRDKAGQIWATAEAFCRPFEDDFKGSEDLADK